MAISIFELFSIGIGPSSSHTVGPMAAALDFVKHLDKINKLHTTDKLMVRIHGSLAHTGDGHGTPYAILNGLAGFDPTSVVPKSVPERAENIIKQQTLNILNKKTIPFHFLTDFHVDCDTLLSKHSNGIQFFAYDKQHRCLHHEIYYSIGGGFIVTEKEYGHATTVIKQPYPFSSCAELLSQCKQHQLSIATLMLENEKVWHDEKTIKTKCLDIFEVMAQCVETGIHTDGILPGVLKVKRRAAKIYQQLIKRGAPNPDEQADMMNWLNLYAMAVNEENAAGGRVVTAPTNGAAGIIPAVLLYFKNYHKAASEDRIITFLLTAGAIGILYKKGASISGAEVGCQGEVGVACSMAAAALTAVLDGTPAQIENAAEIAMEHHLGMTCDPVAGLVQIPCIERNAMGAVKAVNAARLALMGDGNHEITLDKVIATMKNTGRDMMTIYKETSLGGLAVNITEC